MAIATFTMATGSARLAELHAAELPQVDELCGCFHATLALRLFGFEATQEQVALLAGSSQSAGRSRDALPAGETGREETQALPILDEEHAGTAPSGLVRAVAAITDGAVEAVPIAGPFTPVSLAQLIDLAGEASEPVAMSANIATGYLWGSHASTPQLLRYVATGDDGAGPPADWRVGHFVTLLGRIDGPAGSLVLVADTYRSLGSDATYLQPIERMAAAIRRDEMRGKGGVLVYATSGEAMRLRERLTAAGFIIGLWDNGSVDLIVQ
jgi:hypothetical protein